jgi:hypothetical protein
MTVDPLVVGPPQGCQPLCLGCYKKLDLEDDSYRLVTSFGSLYSAKSIIAVSVVRQEPWRRTDRSVVQV